MKSVEERIDYDKKIELCKKLGADKFQKVVFKVEELKFKFIRRFIPRYLEHMDKLFDWIGKKELESSATYVNQEKQEEEQEQEEAKVEDEAKQKEALIGNTVPELIEFAKERGIDLQGKTKKADIFNHIVASLN